MGNYNKTKKSEEWEIYINSLKISGKYGDYLTRNRKSTKKSREKLNHEQPALSKIRKKIQNQKYMAKLKTENGGEGYQRFLEKNRKPAKLRAREKAKKLKFTHEQQTRQMQKNKNY